MWTHKGRKETASVQFNLSRVIKFLAPKHWANKDMVSLLISRGIRCQCYDPRDRIYAILSLTWHDKAFEVDYSEEIVDLFLRVLRYLPEALELRNIETNWDGLKMTPEMIYEAA